MSQKKSGGKKGKKRKKYSKPTVTKHGALSRTALAHSY